MGRAGLGLARATSCLPARAGCLRLAVARALAGGRPRRARQSVFRPATALRIDSGDHGNRRRAPDQESCGPRSGPAALQRGLQPAARRRLHRLQPQHQPDRKRPGGSIRPSPLPTVSHSCRRRDTHRLADRADSRTRRARSLRSAVDGGLGARRLGPSGKACTFPISATKRCPVVGRCRPRLGLRCYRDRIPLRAPGRMDAKLAARWKEPCLQRCSHGPFLYLTAVQACLRRRLMIGNAASAVSVSSSVSGSGTGVPCEGLPASTSRTNSVRFE